MIKITTLDRSPEKIGVYLQQGPETLSVEADPTDVARALSALGNTLNGTQRREVNHLVTSYLLLEALSA